jgi:hypothetical protein
MPLGLSRGAWVTSTRPSAASEQDHTPASAVYGAALAERGSPASETEAVGDPEWTGGTGETGCHRCPGAGMLQYRPTWQTALAQSAWQA